MALVHHEPLVPSINFAMVCPHVYRSGYPTKKNYPFLRALRLRSILYLCPEAYAESNLKFCEENGIRVMCFPTEGNKEPFLDISEPLMHRILSSLCDVRNLPVLIHCNKGKHRTGTVVAALRLLQGWSLVSIFEEYKRFAGDKARVADQQYIELYYPIIHLPPRGLVVPWLCSSERVLLVRTEEELVEAETRQLSHSLLAPEVSPGGVGGGGVKKKKSKGLEGGPPSVVSPGSLSTGTAVTNAPTSADPPRGLDPQTTSSSPVIEPMEGSGTGANANASGAKVLSPSDSNRGFAANNGADSSFPLSAPKLPTGSHS